MYIGPAHTFDDDDLEYLSKDDVDDRADSLEKIKPSPPISSLSIDSLSGIYLGFAEKVKQEEQEDETRDINDIDVTIMPEDTIAVKHKTPKKGRLFSKAKKKKDKESKAAKEVTEDVTKGKNCFKLFRK